MNSTSGQSIRARAEEPNKLREGKSRTKQNMQMNSAPLSIGSEQDAHAVRGSAATLGGAAAYAPGQQGYCCVTTGVGSQSSVRGGSQGGMI